jgi:isocitrate lyase
MSDFPDPEAVRLSLADGAFIDVKKRLTHGERDDMYGLMAPSVTPGAKRSEVRTIQVATYLLGWSLTKRGAPVPMSPDLSEDARMATVRSLSPERFDEIYTALMRHIEAQAAAREAEKNVQGGANGSSAISPSPSGVTGAMSGYAASTPTSTTFSSTN